MTWLGIDSKYGDVAFEIRKAVKPSRPGWDLVRVRSYGGNTRELCKTVAQAKAYGSRLLPRVRWEKSE